MGRIFEFVMNLFVTIQMKPLWQHLRRGVKGWLRLVISVRSFHHWVKATNRNRARWPLLQRGKPLFHVLRPKRGHTPMTDPSGEFIWVVVKKGTVGNKWNYNFGISVGGGGGRWKGIFSLPIPVPLRACLQGRGVVGRRSVQEIPAKNVRKQDRLLKKSMANYSRSR